MLFSGNDGILFIDDTPVMLEMVGKFTEKWGFKPYTAETPEEAIKVFADQPDIKIIFIDYNLGSDQVNGLQLMNHFAGFRSKRNIKLCLLTGDKRKELQDIAPNFGCDAFLTKPIEPKRLKSTIMELLEVNSEKEMMRTQFRVPVDNARASIQDSNIKPVLYVKELTVNSMVLESSAEIEEGTVIQVHIPKLARKLGCSPFFTLKCQRCRTFSSIEKVHGTDWFEGKEYLKGHYRENSLVRAIIVDVSKETQLAIELYQRNLSEKRRLAKSV